MENLHNAWKHRWINPKCESQNSSMHGLGVIAIKPISKGEVVGVLGGIIVPASEIAEYQKKMDHIGIQIDDNFFICPATRDELKETGAFNHSCEPNIGYSTSIKFVAIRDIKPGEELAFDYAFSETIFKPFECKCGSKNCRKIITPDDWKRKDLQEKYGRYFSPFLRRKFMK